jgi:hypothetical protein
MGFNLAFKGLNIVVTKPILTASGKELICTLSWKSNKRWSTRCKATDVLTARCGLHIRCSFLLPTEHLLSSYKAWYTKKYV